MRHAFCWTALEGRRGERPVIMLHDPQFLYNGKRTNKDGLTATLVCGSNAAGEALPPHYQFQTKATTDDGKRLRNEVFKYCQRVIGSFGTDSKRSWGATYGLNMKEGMDDQEFELHVLNSILPLYPHTRNRPGKRLLLKCDSGPGRLQIKLLAKLRYLGVYLYPCMPNTTAVSQETDRTYGGFKSQYGHNLELLVNKLCCWRRVCLFLSTSIGCSFLVVLTRIRNWSWSQHLKSGSCVNGVLTRVKKMVVPPSPANVLVIHR